MIRIDQAKRIPNVDNTKTESEDWDRKLEMSDRTPLFYIKIPSGQNRDLIGLSDFVQWMIGFGSGYFWIMFECMKKQILLLLLLTGILCHQSYTQTKPFEEEVRKISARIDSLGWKEGSTVFTGSSTIRMWKTLESSFPDHAILNTGFGGSKASDLENHLFPLVIRLEPSRIFIYEGDNDLWADVPVAAILTSLDKIVSRLQLINPNTEIYLIGAKPSPSRWEKKESYEIFNKKLMEYCLAKEGVEFIDTWKALIDQSGNPRPELFIQDQLHLNGEGYKVWTEIFKPHF